MAIPQPGPGGYNPQTMFAALAGMFAAGQIAIQEMRNHLVRVGGDVAGVQQHAKDLKDTVLPKVVSEISKMNAGVHKLVDLKVQEKAEKTTTLWKAACAVPKFFYVDSFKNSALSFVKLEFVKGGLWGLLGTSAWTGSIYAAEVTADHMGFEPVGDAIRGARGAVGNFLWRQGKPYALAAGKKGLYYGSVGTAKLAYAIGSAAADDAKNTAKEVVSNKVQDTVNKLRELPIVGDYVNIVSPLETQTLSLEDRVTKQLGSSRSSTHSGLSTAESSDLGALAMLVATAGIIYIACSKLSHYYQAKQLQDDLAKEIEEESR